MSVETVEVEAPAEPKPPKKQPPAPYLVGKATCGFCQTGHHLGTPENPNARCVGAVMNRPEGAYQVYRCPCTCAGNTPRCFTCGTRYSEEEAQTALTSKWECVDQDACKAHVVNRRKSNPALAMIDQFFNERESNMATTAATKAAKTATKTAAPAKPKTGSCKCCGKDTKGGNFLPGHDARYVSEFVQATIAGHTTEAKVKAELKPISEALVGKFTKGLALAKDKAAKAKEADKAAKAAKAAK